MAAWSAKIWEEVIFMLENGTNDCNMDDNTLFVNCTGYLPPGRTTPASSESTMKPRNPGRRYPLRMGTWNSEHVKKTRTSRGIYFSPGTFMQQTIDKKNAKSLKNSNNKKEDEAETKHSYSQIGR